MSNVKIGVQVAHICEAVQIKSYKIYYLDENPFPLLPSGLSNIFVLTSSQKGAKAALTDLAMNVSLHGKPGALALHGDFGVGKTTLLMKFNQELREGKLKFDAEGFPAEVKGIGLRHVFKGPFTEQLTQILNSLSQNVEPADKEKTEQIIREISHSGYISNINSELLRKTMTLNLVGKNLVERLKYDFIHLVFDEVEQELLVIGLENREARLHDFREFLDTIGRIWEQGAVIYQIPFMITLSVSPQAWQYAVSRFQKALPERFLYHVEVPPLISVEDTKQLIFAYLSSARTCELEGCYPFSDDAIQFLHESLK
ncbi:MAG: ATP-binding protein, partial [Candidatus Lokiarchaeota archaeon]|nr:ATP-binding protein [Candidatus Lokiarchaeota archaeon]